jgi:hypothetical protein
MQVLDRWGKGYEECLKIAEDLGEKFKNPEHLCETRFAASECRVYSNCLDNWKVKMEVTEKRVGELRTTDESHIQLCNDLKKLSNLRWLGQLCCTRDLMVHVKHLSEYVQKVNILPWEKHDREVQFEKGLGDMAVVLGEVANSVKGATRQYAVQEDCSKLKKVWFPTLAEHLPSFSHQTQPIGPPEIKIVGSQPISLAWI